MIIATVWLGLAVLLCAYSWAASKRLAALLLPLSAIVAAASLWIATGTPRLTSPPPAKYTVLGAKIVVDEAIYVLLDNGVGTPSYYRLPYTAQQANQLQGALDASQGGGKVSAVIGQDGGTAYEGEPPVSSDQPKPPERPAISLAQ